MKGRRIAPIDHVLLRAEHPTNPLTITGVLIFSEPLDRARLVDLIQDGLLSFERFRQRVVQDPRSKGRFYWQEVPEFDLDYHLQQVSLPAPGDEAALQTLVSHLASAQLDLNRPPWQFHLVEQHGSGSALICRLHHAMADGVALVQALLSLAELPDAAAPPGGPQQADVRASAASKAGSHAAEHRFRRAGLRAAGGLIRVGRSLRHPRATVRKACSQAADLLSLGGTAAATLGTLLLYEPDPQTPLRGALTGRKVAAWSALMPLSDVKLVGRRLGGTVNDVLITALTGAMRRYLLDRGVVPDAAGLRAAVPVNMRSIRAEPTLSNDIGIVFLPLPTGETDPVAGLVSVKRGMDGIKASLEPMVTKGLLQILGVAPRELQDALFSILGTKATALITNVIGPSKPIRLAGSLLQSLIFWVPQSGGVGLGISILSYAGQVRLGVLVDQDVVPDPEAIVAAFEEQVKTLVAIAAGRPEPASIKGMLATLDGTLAAMDSLLVEGQIGKRSARSCQAITRAGQQCKNLALPDSNFCRVHQPLGAAGAGSQRLGG
jgi:WS/DGAT/MGAT family acyltransferase